MWNTTHLQKFLAVGISDYKWRGGNLRNWWESIFPNEPTKLPANPVSRDELRALCANPTYCAKEVFSAVMAWGYMRRDHGRRLVKHLDAVLAIVSNLRHNECSRFDAFSAFYHLRQQGELPGMKATYFTKLIFFCSPKHDGYIMDQWTSKSVNLIKGEKLVKLTSGYVGDNDVDVYKRFCNCMEELSGKGGWTAEETEIRLFSHGGRSKGDWRSYVIENWSNKRSPSSS